MTNVNEITRKIEAIAPKNLACDWDNVGWQVYLGNNFANKVMLCLSPTMEVIRQAIDNKCDLIIAHHPLIFNKINKININNLTSKAAITAIQNNIQIYSAHTNLDSAKGGIADKFCDLLNIKNTFPIEKINEEAGIGRIGELENDKSIEEILDLLKQVLNVKNLKIINPMEKKTAKTIAVCPGSGGDFISKLNNIDLYMTGDIRYHNALEVDNFIVIDAGHLETEKIILPVIADLLEEFNIEILTAKESSPWQVV